MKYCPLAISIMVSILVAHGATDAFLNRHMPPKVPFPDALDSACISVPKLDDVLEYALILGNGDINGLLYSEGGTLILRITKNDVWDARLDTSNDPPLPTLALLKRLAFGDWENRAWILPPGYKLRGLDSYHAHPYPCPRTCAIARISNLPPKPFWKQIRAQGVHNAWKRRGNVTVMSIEGKAGASNGYAFGPLSIATDEYSHLRVRLSGTKNARVFVELQGANNATIFSSGWLDSPMKSKELTFKLPPGKSISRIILYTWTKDGKRAENRFEAVEFVGKSDTLSINLSTIAPPTCPAKLDIRRAVAHVDGISGGPPKAVVRALAHCNAFLIESSAQVELLPVRTPEIPAPACGERNGVKWLHQRIPGDLDWAGMEFAVALATNGNRRAIAVVTSLESSDVIGDAVKLAQSVAMANLSNTIDKHEAIWERFWSVSGIDISDELLCKEWYRNLYFLRCVTKPGVVSPGLFASLIDEHPAWHGDYHTNYNIQQTFWSCFITNHTDLLEPYERLVVNYLPRARWLARRIFNCNGAYFPHVLFAYEPAHPERCRSRNGRQYIHHVWGFTIGVSGFTVQPLWWRYKHEPHADYLAKVAYPAIRDVATFYADFMEQCVTDASGKVVLAPSVSPEHWGWTPKFERNRNCTFDIAMVRCTLRAAIEGAMRLGRDADLIERFRKALQQLPDYPTTKGDMPIVVDVEGAPPIVYNIAVPATPVFPGNVITWWSPESVKRTFARTIAQLRWNGNNSMVILAVARARLSMPQTLEWLRNEVNGRLRANGTLSLNRRGHQFNRFGHYTEQFAISMAVSELLLQSVGDIIRILPAYPKGMPAQFRNLLAQGGFLVSASQRNGEIECVEVTSLFGERLRLLSPWRKAIIWSSTGKVRKVTFKSPHHIIELATQPGEHLVFKQLR